MSRLFGGGMLVLCALVAAVTAGGGDAARSVTRPPGTPDLAMMAIRTSDLPGARVTRQGYVKPDESDVASYEREFAAFSVKIGAKRLLALESDVDLARTAGSARSVVSLVPVAIGLIDPKELAKEFASGSGGLRATYVRISKAQRIRAGDLAYAVTLSIGTKLGEIRTLLVFIQVNRVVDLVVAVGSTKGPAIGFREAGALARLTAAHSHDGLLPINTSPPAVTGTPMPGQTLSATPGEWSNKPVTFAYAWQRCDATGEACVDTGTSGPSYPVTTADAGSTLRVAVTATNSVGSSRAVSAATALVAGAPVNTAPPTVGGTPAVGQTLTATTGTWSGAPTTFAYQWQRCDQAGAVCSDIAGATAATYAATSDDVGSTLRVAVTATNASAAAVAYSAPTPVVAG